MSSKVAFVLGCAAVLALSPWAGVVAQEAPAPAAEAEKVDKEMEDEIAYVTALIDSGYPDFAEPLIAATKKRWPASDAQLFAIEIRGLLSLGKFDEAERAARIAVARMPDNWRVWETLADVLLSKGADIAAAQAAVERAEGLAKDVPDVQKQTLTFLRGWLEFKSGHRDVDRKKFGCLKRGNASPELAARMEAVLKGA